MEYLILNEESLPFNSVDKISAAVPVFFDLISVAFNNNFIAIHVSDTFDSGWYNMKIAPSLFLRDWIQEQDHDYKGKLKTLIDKTKFPRIPKHEIEINEQYNLSDFLLKNKQTIKTPSLGAAYLLGQIAISFNSVQYWNLSTIELIHTSINLHSEIVDTAVVVKNITDHSHWQEHFALIEEQRRNNNRKGKDLWINRCTIFPNLIFCGMSEKQITNLSISDALFNKFWHCLRQLNDNIKGCTNDHDFIQKISLTITDESMSVKNNKRLRRYREFFIPDNGKHFFGLHIKNFPGSWRLHFYPDYHKNCVSVGYFGKHLPL